MSAGEEQAPSDLAEMSGEFSDIRAHQHEVYRNITKVDENKDKKIDERTNTTTEKIIQNELHKGTFDEEDPAISVPGRKAGAFEADAEKRLAAQLGSYANKEGPGVTYAELNNKLSEWAGKSQSVEASEAELKKGMETFYKQLWSSTRAAQNRIEPAKAKVGTLDANRLHALASLAGDSRREESSADSKRISLQKKSPYSEQELIQEECGMEHIQYRHVPDHAIDRGFSPKKEMGRARITGIAKGRPLWEQLKEEFGEGEDPQLVETLNSVELEDQLVAGLPAISENSRIGKVDRPDLFYYLHLSPFARKAIDLRGVENEQEIMELYLNYLPLHFYSKEGGGVSRDSYFSAIAGTLPLRHYFTAKRPQDRRESYRAEPAAPSRESLISEREEENEITSLASSAHAEVNDSAEPGPGSEDRSKASMEPEAGEGEVQDSLPPFENGEDEAQEQEEDQKAMADEEKPKQVQPARQAETADPETSPDQAERQKLRDSSTSVPHIQNSIISLAVGQLDLPPSPSPIGVRTTFGHMTGSDERMRLPPAEQSRAENTRLEGILKDTEELLVAYTTQTTQGLQKELSRRIYENMEKVIDTLNSNQGQQHDEQTLVRLAEIGKKYLEGPVQARLLRAILEEYRRVQEGKIKQLETEKQTLEASQQIGRRYSLIQALLNVFPEDLLRELEGLKKARSTASVGSRNETETISEHSEEDSVSASSVSKESRTAHRKRLQGPHQTKGKPLPRLKSAAWDVRHAAAGMGPRQASAAVIRRPKLVPSGAKTKTGSKRKGKSKKALAPQQSARALRSDDADTWIGTKSTELENEEMWERGGVPQI